MIKPGGLLDKAMGSRLSESGTCQNCGNLVQVSNNTLGCAAHDKFIIPNYPPYHGNAKCKDWKTIEGGNEG